jgi:hypothetical protein
MAFMDIFSTKPQQQPPANPQQQGNPQVTQNQPVKDPSGLVDPNNPNPSNPQNPQANKEANPLDAYSGMWDTSKQGKDEQAPSFTIDPKVLDTVTGQLDFKKGVNPETLQKAMAGDSSAMIDVMEQVSRQAYRTAIEHSSHLTDKFVGAREGFNEKSLPGKVRGELTQHALSDTPNYSHPVVKRQLTEIAKQLAKVHPDASPQEIAKMSKTYLSELASALNPTDPNAAKPGDKPAEMDWDKYFDESEPS